MNTAYKEWADASRQVIEARTKEGLLDQTAAIAISNGIAREKTDVLEKYMTELVGIKEKMPELHTTKAGSYTIPVLLW